MTPSTCGHRSHCHCAPSSPSRSGSRPSRTSRRSTPTMTTLRLMAPSAYVRDRILTRYLPLVTEALQDVNEGQRIVEIDVGVERCRPGARRSRRPAVENRQPDTPRHERTRRRPGCAPPRAHAARRRRPQSALHVRDVRQGRVEPVRPGRGTARRRDPGAQLQPAVHLRLGGAGQDPPAARHRALRPLQLSASRGPLRLDRDVHERVRRRDSLEHRRPRCGGGTATSTCC